MNSHITLSQAVEGYLLDARARQLSRRTITDYASFAASRIYATVALNPMASITTLWRFDYSSSIESKSIRYISNTH
jgi:hypothetical protein